MLLLLLCSLRQLCLFFPEHKSYRSGHQLRLRLSDHHQKLLLYHQMLPLYLLHLHRLQLLLCHLQPLLLLHHQMQKQLYLLLLSWNRSWILPVIRLTWIFFSFRFSSFISRISGQLYAQKRQLHILQLPLSHKYMVYMYQIYLLFPILSDSFNKRAMYRYENTGSVYRRP